MKEYKGIRVLVLDGYGRQIASIVQQLHDLGCVITTLNCSKLDIGYTSHYPRKRLVHPETRDDNEALKRVLYKEITSGKYDAVFPMREPSTEILLQNEDVFSKYVKIIAAPYNAFEKAYDKQETMRICMENGIPCPITKMDNETLDDYLAKVSFPLACKPRKGSGGAGFKKVNNREEMDNYINTGVIKVEDYVIQEYIQQTEHMNNCYVMLDNNHNPVYSVAIETCRWYPVDGGPGCYGRTIDKPILNENAIKLLQKMNWSGFGQVSFMVDPRDMVPKVSEINGRISAGIKMMALVGCNPVKYLLDRAFEEPIMPISHTIPVGQGLRYFHTDILWFIKSSNRFKSDPSWFDFRRSSDYIFSWRDPVPFFSYTISHIKTYRKDMEKRKH